LEAQRHIARLKSDSELLKKLPASEGGAFEATLMAFELQQELKQVLTSKPEDIKKEIALISEKAEGFGYTNRHWQ